MNTHWTWNFTIIFWSDISFFFSAPWGLHLLTSIHKRRIKSPTMTILYTYFFCVNSSCCSIIIFLDAYANPSSGRLFCQLSLHILHREHCWGLTLLEFKGCYISAIHCYNCMCAARFTRSCGVLRFFSCIEIKHVPISPICYYL